MLSEERLDDLAEQLIRVSGIVAVVLGGSRARRTHTEESDVDIGLYYRSRPDIEALQALAVAWSGAPAAVTQPGDWGPWVNGGGWLQIDGAPVDWIYRDLDRVNAAWADAQAGRFAFHFQVGHPLGVPDFAYAGEVALCRVLRDPTGELRRLSAQARSYRAALRDAVVATLWEADFDLALARKAINRGDAAYVSGCLFRAFEICAHALHADAGRWLINEKGAVSEAGLCPRAPADFSERAHGIMARIGRDPESLLQSIQGAQALVSATSVACNRPEHPETRPSA